MQREDFDRLEGKLDRMGGDVAGIRVTQAVQTQQLAEHMRRTELAEETLKAIRSEADQKIALLRIEIAPLKKTREEVVWAAKFAKIAVAAVTAIGTAIATVMHLLGKI